MPPVDSAIDHARRLLCGFGMTLKETRDQENVSLRDLYDVIGVRPEVISRVEQGKWMPSHDEYRALSEWMGQHPLRQG
jgi:transcriptional regulator with XRE-family HTH domain